jgi:hypothetical protein
VGGAARWSDHATWGGAAPPNSEGDRNDTQIMFIPNGTHLLLDVAQLYIRIWVIEGKLTISDESNVDLGTRSGE